MFNKIFSFSLSIPCFSILVAPLADTAPDEVAAILFYAHIKKDNLVKPMVLGWKDSAHGESARGGGWIAFVVALALAVLAVYGASGAWLPESPPPAAVETPAW